jgi:hypothetical protein
MGISFIAQKHLVVTTLRDLPMARKAHTHIALLPVAIGLFMYPPRPSYLNDEVDELAKQGAEQFRIVETLVYFICQHTPYWSSIP